MGWLDDRTDRRFFHWTRSQFAIHDFEDLANLDAPWWSYGAIDAVEAWLEAQPSPIRAFEWGSGASTLWLSRRVDELHSTEHDIEFADLVRPHLPEHVHFQVIPSEVSQTPRTPSKKSGYRGQDFSAYVAAIDQVDGSFDLICVDGRARVACVRAALERLAPDGLIVLDNTGRQEYREALATIGAACETYRGWTPALPYMSSTTLIRPSRAAATGTKA